MKTIPMLTAAVMSVSMALATSSVFAATPVHTMATGAATQTLVVSGGCKTLKTTDTVTVTFFDDDTYTIVDSSAATVLQGTWSRVDSGTSKYTLYMSPAVFAPDPNTDRNATPPAAGTLEDFVSQLQIVGDSNCEVKFPGRDVNFVQPSSLVKKSSLVVTTKNNEGILTVQVKGKQTNNFYKDGTIVKPGSYSVTLTIKGTVT